MKGMCVMRRNILLKLVILIFTSMILFKASYAYVTHVSQAQMTAENENYISEPKNITCTTKNHINNREHSSGFSYSDDVFFNNAETEDGRPDGDIAKICASLMSAAYYESSIIDVLKNDMKYDVVTTYDYDRNATYTDNDYVAFSVAKKKLVKDGKKYCLYMVVVRGTPSSGEWYSNFRLGKNNGGNHEGFYKAAREVLRVLEKEWFDYDEAEDRDYRKVMITGHSRGAAVANIVAGELSDSRKYARRDSIFGYTYACPSVSKSANEAYTNIYNFNNSNDIITALPLETWGYKRYGKTISLDRADIQFENFKQRFISETGYEYNGTKSGNVETFISALSDFVVSEEAYNSEEAQLAFDLLAYALGGKNDTQFQPAEFFAKHGIFFSKYTLKKLSPNLYELFEDLKEISNENTGLEGEISDALTETSGMGEDEWISWKNSNYLLIDKISEITNIIINKRSDLFLAYSQIVAENNKIGKIGAIFTDIILLFIDSSGNPKNAIWHGHAALTYELWINSMYFGYYGWKDNDTIDHIAIDGCKYVGAYCFYDCDGLTELVIPDAVEKVEAMAFAYCDNIVKVKMPVDLNYSHADDTYSFYGVDVEEIVYTKGKTGVMLNKTDNSRKDDEAYYYGSIEYQSRYVLKKITFSGEITQIGNKSFYECEVLKTIEGEENIKRIGSQAFYECKVLEGIDLSEVEELGEGTFYNCDSLTEINIIKVKNVPESCFYGCDGLTELVIPDTVEKVEKGAFAYCNNLNKVTMPVDLDYVHATNNSLPSFCSISTSPFSGAQYYHSKVEEIVYTKGRTGVMLDKTDNSSKDDEAYYYGSIEYQSRYVLKKITFSGEITQIGNKAFYECEVLKTVEGEENIKRIGSQAFYACKALEDIDLSEDVELESETFYECTALEGIDLSEVEELGEGTFYNCDSLTEINIIKVKNVPESCFYGCDGLTELVIPDTVEKVEKGAFAYCNNLNKVTMPVDLDYVHATNNSLPSFCSISTSPFSGAQYYHSKVEEIVYTKGKTGIMLDKTNNLEDDKAYFGGAIEYQSFNTLKKVTFSEGVTQIGDLAFYNVQDGIKMQFSKSINKISTSAFPSTWTDATVFYGYEDTVVQSYAADRNVSFVPLEKPIINNNISQIERGKMIQFTAQVYTDMENYTDNVTWSIENVVDNNTKISDSGLLYISDSEKSNMVKICASYGTAKTVKEIKVIIPVYNVTLTVNGNTLCYDSIDEALAEIEENAVITIYTDQKISCLENEQNREIILPENVTISSENDAVLTIDGGVNVSGGNYELNVVNNGVINSATINEEVRNNQIISDCVIGEKGIVDGGILTGNIQNNGIIRNVNADNANISGNEIENTVTPSITQPPVKSLWSEGAISYKVNLAEGTSFGGSEHIVNADGSLTVNFSGSYPDVAFRIPDSQLVKDKYRWLEIVYTDNDKSCGVSVYDSNINYDEPWTDNSTTKYDLGGECLPVWSGDCIKIIDFNTLTDWNDYLTQIDIYAPTVSGGTSNNKKITIKSIKLYSENSTSTKAPTEKPTSTPTSTPTTTDEPTENPTKEPVQDPSDSPTQKPDATKEPPATQQPPSESTGITPPANNNISTPPAGNTDTNIQPPAVAKIVSAKNAKKSQVVIKWNKAADISGCEIQYSNNKKFKKAKKKTTKKGKYTIKKLKRNKTYYIRLRTYKIVNGAKVYGSWSKPKKIKIKK